MCKFSLSPSLSSELSCPASDGVVPCVRVFLAQQSSAADATSGAEYISPNILFRGLKAVFKRIPTSF